MAPPQPTSRASERRGAVRVQRHEATKAILDRSLTSDSFVIEVGSNDASFRPHTCATARWVTIDKYGEPDIRVDINGADVSLPFEEESCDLILCTEVLEHLTLGSPFVREMARILKPSGVAVISVPNIASLKSRVKLLLGGLPNMAASGDCGPPLGGTGILSEEGHWIAGHVVDFNQPRLRAYLERAGFSKFRWHSVPVRVPLGKASFTLPAWALPSTLPDFLLVEARK